MTTERWQVTRLGVATTPESFSGTGTIVCDRPGSNWPASDAHWPRRSRLIAAAPDLLEALELVLDFNKGDSRLLWRDIKPGIEDALAKARPAGLDAKSFAQPEPEDMTETLPKRKFRVGFSEKRTEWFLAERVSHFEGCLTFWAGDSEVALVAPGWLYVVEVND